MAKSDVEIKLGLDTSGAESDAKSAGKAIGDKAGDGIEQGLDSGSKSGAKKAESNIDGGGMKSAGKNAGDKAGKAIGDGIEEGTKDGVADAEKAVEGLGGGIEAALGALGIGAGVAGIFELVEQSADSSFKKIEAGAKFAGASMESATKSYEDFVGITGDAEQAVEAANNAFRLCQGDTEQLAEWTNIAAGAYATLGDSLPIENLTEAANETARTGTVTGGLADALNWATLSTDEWRTALGDHKEAQEVFNEAINSGMTAEDAFNEALASCNDEQERGQLITDTLSNIYGEAGENYLETNDNAVEFNKTQDELNRTLQDAGEKFMPLVTDALQWFIDNGGIVVPIIAALAGALAAMSIASTVAAGISAIQEACAIATPIVAAFNGVLAANPIVAVIAVLAALVGALIWFFTQTELGQQIWQQFTDFLSLAAETIKNALSNAAQWVQDRWNELTNFMSSIPGKIKGFFSDIAAWFSSKFEAVKTGIENGFNAAVDFVSSIPGKIKGFFSGAGSWLINSGRALMDGFVSGIRRGFDAAVGAVQNGLSYIRGFFPFSPAKRGPFSGSGYTTYSGKALMRDFGKGISDGMRIAEDEAARALAGVQASLSIPVTATLPIASGGQTIQYITNDNRQDIAFNQPVKTPAETARLWRMQQRYGLAGAR